MSPARRWRRGDGAVLSGLDLAEAAPMMPYELDDIVRLVDLVEEWLRFDDVARDLLTDWLAAISGGHRADRSAQDVIDELGTVSVKLHRLIRAGAPDTGPVHPPLP